MPRPVNWLLDLHLTREQYALARDAMFRDVQRTVRAGNRELAVAKLLELYGADDVPEVVEPLIEVACLCGHTASLTHVGTLQAFEAEVERHRREVVCKECWAARQRNERMVVAAG